MNQESKQTTIEHNRNYFGDYKEPVSRTKWALLILTGLAAALLAVTANATPQAPAFQKVRGAATSAIVSKKCYCGSWSFSGKYLAPPTQWLNVTAYDCKTGQTIFMTSMQGDSRFGASIDSEKQCYRVLLIPYGPGVIRARVRKAEEVPVYAWAGR